MHQQQHLMQGSIWTIVSVVGSSRTPDYLALHVQKKGHTSAAQGRPVLALSHPPQSHPEPLSAECTAHGHQHLQGLPAAVPWLCPGHHGDALLTCRAELAGMPQALH